MATTNLSSSELDSLFGSNPSFQSFVQSRGIGSNPDTPIDQISGQMSQAYQDWVSNMSSSRDAVMASNGLYGNYGSAGPVSVYSTNTPWSDIGYSNPGIKPGQVAAYPGQEQLFADFQSKYPNYAQIAGLAMGPGAGTETTMRQYVQDPSSIIHDPVYGDIAPILGTGSAGKKPIPFMKAGGGVLAAMAASGLGSSVLSGLSEAGSAGAGTSAGGAGAAASGAGSVIPDYTSGILANAGNFGLPTEAAVPALPVSSAAGGFSLYDLPATFAQNYLKSLPASFATNLAGQAISGNFDIGKLLGGTLKGGLAGGVGATLGPAITDLTGLPSWAAKPIGAVGGALAGGKDLKSAVISAIMSGGGQFLSDQLGIPGWAPGLGKGVLQAVLGGGLGGFGGGFGGGSRTDLSGGTGGGMFGAGSSPADSLIAGVLGAKLAQLGNDEKKGEPYSAPAVPDLGGNINRWGDYMLYG